MLGANQSSSEKAFHKQFVKRPYPDPETQVLVILAEYDFLIVSLGYQFSESSASLQAKRLHNAFRNLKSQSTGLGKLQNISSKDIHLRFSPSIAQRSRGMRRRISYSSGVRVNTVAASAMYMSQAGI